METIRTASLFAAIALTLCATGCGSPLPDPALDDPGAVRTAIPPGRLFTVAHLGSEERPIAAHAPTVSPPLRAGVHSEDTSDSSGNSGSGPPEDPPTVAGDPSGKTSGTATPPGCSEPAELGDTALCSDDRSLIDQAREACGTGEPVFVRATLQGPCMAPSTSTSPAHRGHAAALVSCCPAPTASAAGVAVCEAKLIGDGRTCLDRSEILPEIRRLCPLHEGVVLAGISVDTEACGTHGIRQMRFTCCSML